MDITDEINSLIHIQNLLLNIEFYYENNKDEKAQRCFLELKKNHYVFMPGDYYSQYSKEYYYQLCQLTKERIDYERKVLWAKGELRDQEEEELYKHLCLVKSYSWDEKNKQKHHF